MSATEKPKDDAENEFPIKGYRLMRVLPCMAAQEKIRVVIAVEGDIAAVLPYLNATIKGAIFNPNSYSLTFKDEDVMWTLQPGQATIAKIDDEEDAGRRMEAFLAQVESLWRRRSEIEPCYDRRNSLPAIEVFKLLPGTNCGRCDVPTCMAFAVKIVAGNSDVTVCGPLFQPEWLEKRKRILELLQNAGYSVPNY